MLFLSCNDASEVIYNLYECDVPEEIQAMAAPGDTVHWDCTWQTAYNNGRVSYVKKDDGTLLAIVRTYPASYDISADTLNTTP